MVTSRVLGGSFRFCDQQLIEAGILYPLAREATEQLGNLYELLVPLALAEGAMPCLILNSTRERWLGAPSCGHVFIRCEFCVIWVLKF